MLEFTQAQVEQIFETTVLIKGTTENRTVWWEHETGSCSQNRPFTLHLGEYESDIGQLTCIIETEGSFPTILAYCSHESGDVIWVSPKDDVEISVRWKSGQPAFFVSRC